MRKLIQQLHPKAKDFVNEQVAKLNFPLSAIQKTIYTKLNYNRPFHEPKLEELLNRPPIEVDLTDVSHQLSNQVVLVTGGGGSIGSELCRQIIKMRPQTLLILDHSELNLYMIDCELKEMKSDVPVKIILADIKDMKAVKNVFDTYKPSFVYHAAAYKHVHLVENNPYVSIINNIVGTRNLVDCSLNADVDTFVMISTDKAVNPSSVMGSTKRVCELVVTEAATKTQKRFCSVRFGNVLGSSGSLIPLLKKQVYAGGPVTITHPDMTRYFMLIPEAVRLVLKAGSISTPGDVNILKMGEPVKIVDIAKKVITLMGRTEEEIPIAFVGMRPGEKLYEELYLVGNETETRHKDIMVLPNGDSVYDPSQFDNMDLRTVVASLVNYSIENNEKALVILNRLVFMHKREKKQAA